MSVKFLESKYLESKKKRLNNPPQSLDLNIIDVVWGHLDRERNKGQLKFEEKLGSTEGSLVFF